MDQMRLVWSCALSRVVSVWADLLSHSTGGGLSCRGPLPKHCPCSQQQKPMAGFSFEGSSNSAAFVGIDSPDSLSEMGRQKGNLRPHPSCGHKTRVPPWQTLRRLSVHSFRFGRRSTSHAAHFESSWFVKFLKGICPMFTQLSVFLLDSQNC